MPPSATQHCVFFHAHPDDEALLTAGTMAMLAAEGHRVVLVVATAGERGLAELRARARRWARRRMAELHGSAAAARLRPGGVARLRRLGAGRRAAWPTTGRRTRSSTPTRRRPPQRLAAVLEEENADLLTIYDPAGGYGHPDHVQVHRVGTRAAEIAGTPIVLEATVNRDPLLRRCGWWARFYRFPPEFDIRTFERAYSPSETITHRVNVRQYAKQKRAAWPRTPPRPPAATATARWPSAEGPRPALPAGLRHRMVRPARPAARHPAEIIPSTQRPIARRRVPRPAPDRLDYR